MTDNETNKWLKENTYIEVVDIKFSAGGFAIIYKERQKTNKKEN